MTAPLHNSIAPFPKLYQAGVRCYLGIDNIHDLFMPMVDGDIWTECRDDDGGLPLLRHQRGGEMGLRQAGPARRGQLRLRREGRRRGWGALIKPT